MQWWPIFPNQQSNLVSCGSLLSRKNNVVQTWSSCVMNVCVLLTKNLELQHPSFQCLNPARVLKFCLHAFLTLCVVLPTSPPVFYELRVCVNWLWPLFCLYVVRIGLHVRVCSFPCGILSFSGLFILLYVLQVHCSACIASLCLL